VINIIEPKSATMNNLLAFCTETPLLHKSHVSILKSLM
jgi:hypothetical protein